MELIDTAAVFHFHKEQIKEFGAGSTGALGWTSSEAQIQRFEILAAIADLNEQTVLDAGCGYGDLSEFLHSRYPLRVYIGVEQIPELLDIAVQKYASLPETIFLQGDFTSAAIPVTDYILVCGSLNYRSSDPDFIYHAIEKLFGKCKKGLGFNLLSMVHIPHELIVAYHPSLIFDFCQKLTPHVILKDGYRDNDYTIFMYHEGSYLA